jgi:chemotaxis protein methyltransferase CheR
MNAVLVTRDELAVWARYVQEICGIHLDGSKSYLVEARLKGLLEETGTGSFSELYYRAKGDASCKLRRKVIDAIATNETSFFRDTSPFELLQHKIIPDLIDARGKTGMKPIPLRVWSAACSTGQEVYSIAILLKELLGDFRGYDVRILGTDISDKAVAQASYGAFNKMDLDRGLPSDKVSKYFLKAGDQWKIRDDIRAMTTFRNVNLLEPFSFPARFDIVFCRNVAIYFTESDKIRLFRSVARCLATDGCLIIGATESLLGLCPEFESLRYLRSVFYRLKSPK